MYITYTSCSSIRCLFILLVEPSARGIHAITPPFSQTEHRAHLSWRGDNLKWFHSHVLVNFAPVGCAADFTALSGGLSSKVLAFLERCVSSSASFTSDNICHAGKPLHVTCNRLNGPSKVLTATDGQQIKLTANYFSWFNHVISKLPGHGHSRPSKTIK